MYMPENEEFCIYLYIYIYKYIYIYYAKRCARSEDELLTGSSSGGISSGFLVQGPQPPN